MPFGNTVEAYRRAFGYLDYLWSVDGHSFDRDSGQLVELPSGLIKQCRFICINCTDGTVVYPNNLLCYTSR